MKGCIVQRSKGSWGIVIDVGRDPETGKRRQQWHTVRGTKGEADRKLRELLHSLETGGYVKPTRLTLGEYLERWLRDYACPSLAPRTVEGYTHIIRQHLIPGLGLVPLAQLKPQHLQNYYAEKLARGRRDGKGGLSPRTVRHHHITLHGALQSAVKWGLLARNPADAVDAPRYQSPEMRTLDQDGLRVFLEAARSTPYYALFYLALFTGMRRSELLALRWSNVNLDLGQVVVNRGLHHLRNGSIVFRAPKSAKGRRLIALPPSAALALHEHRDQQEAERLIIGVPLTEDSLVFAHPDGSPLLPDTVTHAWIDLARRAGFPHIRLHDARHTHASLMLRQGVHPKIVSERLGHATVSITLDTYSHVTPGLQEAAARRFDEGLLVRPAATVSS